MSPLVGWRPALRIAWREAWRAKGRSVLVLLLIGLPVMGVVALDSLYRTSEVSTVEGLDRRLGAADALVTDVGAPGPLDQNPEAQAVNWPGGGPALRVDPASIERALGAGTRVTPLPESGSVGVRTPDGLATVTTMQLDLRNPVTNGLVRRVSGAVPATPDEVALSPALAARSSGLGTRITLVDGSRRTVVGIVDSATERGSLFAVGVPGWLPRSDGAAAVTSYLVQTAAPVTWSDVRRANQQGLVVLSRAVVQSPPPPSAVPADVRTDGSTDSATLAVIGLVAAMAVLEVVLLAGPALAVGARRQQRSLALIRAAGGRPRDVRRTVLATGVVVGALGCSAGLVLGLLLAWSGQPLVQRVTATWFGPFQVSWRDSALIAAVGFVSAVVAAYVPARLATRVDVVAVLAGRRGEPAPTYRSPLLGALLLVVGMLAAASGARGSGTLSITAGAVLSVLGMVLLVPLVLALTGRLAGRLPLSARYAVRDAARQRSRTAPAVAAVAATVAGVVALGIGSASDSEEQARTYAPSGPAGAAVVTAADGSSLPRDQVTAAARRILPEARVLPVRGVRTSLGRSSLDVQFSNPDPMVGSSYSTSLGSGVLAAPVDLRRLQVAFDPAREPAIRRVLAAGGAVVFEPGPTAPRPSRMTVTRYDAQGNESGNRTITVRTLYVTPFGASSIVQAVVSPDVLRRAGLSPSLTALVLDGTTIGTGAEERLREAVSAVAPATQVTVERGFHDDASTLVTLLLGLAGGVLMLGGTLTATFLALSDARPDLATLAAVGAAPGRRRTIAASYAVTTALLGSLLGALVGFVPGLAITYPLTSGVMRGGTDLAGQPLPSHFVDVPWLLVLGLVVVLPLVTALVVAALVRSRLPMTARVG